MLLPEAQIANLDAGDLVAGSTRWDSDGDGVFFNETRVGFLWSPLGGAQAFRISEALYDNPSFYFPSAISDTGAVSGTAVYRLLFQSLPFLWTSAAGLQFLPLTCPGPPPTVTGGPSTDCSGSAVGVSADGAAVAGQVIDALGDAHAARWRLTRGKKPRAVLEVLPSSDPSWSDALAISADGRVVVGESGVSAARWIDGVPQTLEAVGEFSIAVLTSADGSTALGSAFVNGRGVLVQWDATGAAQVTEPPEGWTLESLRAANAAATAAVGALAFNGNWAPYVWTSSGGFEILPELGREADYDNSEAVGLSEDGSSVIGTLQASVISNGDPPSLAFLWTADGGVVTLNTLLEAAGFVDPDFFQALAISADGRKILATGNPPGTLNDTNSIVLTLEAP